MRAAHLLVPALLLLLPAACRKREEKVPEHVLEQQARERARLQRVKGQKQQRRSTDAAVDHWPAPVQQAYLALLEARGPEMPQVARALAQQGLAAAPALREIASSPAQAPAKRALSSILLVELHLAQPQELERLAAAEGLPDVRRAALEALVRLGRPVGQEALERLLRGAAPAEQRAMRMLVERERRASRPWNYTTEQLLVLDRVLQARQPLEVSVALDWVKDLSLEAGLLRVLASGTIPVPVQGAVATKMVKLAGEKPGQLQRYLGRAYPPLLRLATARSFLADPGGRKLILQQAADKEDPLGPVLKQLVERAERQQPP